METGSTSKSRGKAERVKGGGTTRLSSMLQKIEPFMPRIDHNPNELRSWAKRTGFVSDYSGGTQASASEKNDSALFDLEKGLDSINGGSSPKIEIDPVLGRTKPNRGIEIEPVVKNERDGTGRGEDQSRRTGDEAKVDERKVGSNGSVHRNGNGNVNGIANANGNGHGNEVPAVAPAVEPKKDDSLAERDAKLDFPYGEEPAPVSLIYYGLQHYLSLAGSLIFIPSIIVPAMGGTDKDIATVISTMLLVSGVTTILHSYFGTRLPLVQGSSYVYLAPALVIMNAREYRDLTEHKFRHIMRELQGAIIVGSIFQSILGYSGLMSLFLRFINPVVVAPTVAAVGLAFFSYGFPEAGSCVEISIPQILLLLIFALYLRGISIFGHRVFRIYAVPLSIMIIWTYAFFLTAGGAYNYKGCSPDIPSSNILIDACRKHAYTMKHCRTDVSNAWRAAAWVRIPYPLQWGIPIFHLRTSMIMIIVSLVASVDSVGTYHSASVRVNSKPPSPGIVSRGIAMEGFCSILAGLWGSGTGSTTLTENVHTIDITKVASRRAVEVGAVFLILFSFVGKVGAILASIPQALAASVLCFMWALIVALGLSTLQYSQTASFRNITIVGVSLFLGLSIPAYFQQYQPESSLILPSYFVPYAAASSGPVYTGSKQLDFALNAILSLNMVVTLLVAFVLDNTVPGSRQERGVYIWSRAEEIANDPSLLSDYALPRKVAKCFYWARCLGV
ncbi:nucleobase-ascorbate transporter 11-like isoform X2 [Juglans microcarpa x Juglans regia]|uniref:nucleobase-ascorbate transporter 11-like isoform X2 n=1 Tax=Juglans microcarpa x Juglans regia TaxID=2249226 RepID=UPI001B7EF641|nr:nucleobase-ascorbate transporter 11-like isoform X2 [Juglans microcarpa x Juglans regia]